MIKLQQDLAVESGHAQSNISWAIRTGLIPAPDIVGVKRRYYSATQYRKALLMLCNRPDISGLTMAQICRSAKISRVKFNALRSAGLFPEPIGYRGKREIWSEDILPAIKKAIQEKKKQRPKREPDNYYTQQSAAKKLGCPAITFQSWVANGTVAKATHQIDGYPYLYYSEIDLKAIRDSKATYFESRRTT